MKSNLLKYKSNCCKNNIRYKIVLKRHKIRLTNKRDTLNYRLQTELLRVYSSVQSKVYSTDYRL